VTESASRKSMPTAPVETAETEHPLATYLQELYARHVDCNAGEVASYIPELARAVAADFGIAIATTDGRVYTVGDCDKPFSIQSISKPFAYALALEDNGMEGVLEKVGLVPTGNGSDRVSLFQESGRPFNPMINAGAIAATSLVRDEAGKPRVRRILDLMSRCAGRPLQIDDSMVASERHSGIGNFAIDYMLRNSGIIGSVLEPVLECYSQQCSTLVTCRDLAVMAATLAAGGVCPTTHESVLEESIVSNVLGVMATCGMYDYAGEWVARAGMPSKSGIGGGVIGVLPGQVGIAVYSPPLDTRGNSVRGVRVFHDLSEDFGLHLFQATRSGKSLVRRRYDASTVSSKRMRRSTEAKALTEHGQRIVVFELQGELTLFSIERVIRDLLALPSSTDWLIIDFKRITTADWPALDLWMSFWERNRQRFREVIITGLDAEAGLQQYFSAALARKPAALLLAMEEADTALELCEDQLLYDIRVSAPGGIPVSLENFDLCEGLDEASIAVLRSVLKTRRFKSGESIVEIGDPADSLFFLASGQVSVTIDLAGGSTRRLTTCTPGMIFGEMAILERRPRSAVVRADTPVECWELAIADFEHLTSTHPDLKVKLLENFARSLSIRVRRLTDEVRTLSE
jgi:glutaminase